MLLLELLRPLVRVPEVARVHRRADNWRRHRRKWGADRRAAGRVLHVRLLHVCPVPMLLLDLWMKLRSGMM